MLPVLDYLTVGIAFVDDGGLVLDVNRALVEMLGLPRAQIVGRAAAALGVPVARDEVRAFRVEERWLEARTTRTDESWLVEVVDVTAAHTARAAHRQSERQQRTLLSNLPGLVYRCKNDPQWTIEFISEGSIALTGHTPEAFTSGEVSYGMLIHPSDRERVWHDVQTGLAARVPFHLVYRLVDREGDTKWIKEQGTGVFDDAGTLLALEGFCSDITEQHEAEAALRASAERYRSMFERNQAVKWIIDPADGRIVDVNEAAARFYGYTKEQLKRMHITDINMAPPGVVRSNMALAQKESRVYFEFRHRKANGEIVDVEVHSGPIELDGRALLFSIVHDISEKKRLEEALRHAQKMEALGRLAGGVAHDFNNLMTVIVGATSLMLLDLPPSTQRDRVVEIAEAGKRAARLTRQLLAVGRRQLLAPQIIDLNAHVEGMVAMLRPAMPADVELVADASASPPWVEADPDQLEQVVLNLALNARDAMPRGGKLTIRSRNLVIEARDPATLDLPAGRYVVLDVADTGVGIDPARMRHIFEPFYTTKPGHEGSGLGLATVYGIVKQSGGNVAVESVPGQGSTFCVALPSAEAPDVVAASPPAARPLMKAACETVLVVDDDELVRRLTALMLEVQGYRVLVANDGEDALRIAEVHPGPIHLVLTDVMMPRLAGGALVERLLPIRPDVRVLFVSGYVDELASPAGTQSARTAFLQKPATPEDLAAKIRGLLDA